LVNQVTLRAHDLNTIVATISGQLRASELKRWWAWGEQSDL
jgi:hypothetical protein